MSDLPNLPGLEEIRKRFFARLTEKIVQVESAWVALETPNDPTTAEHLRAAEAVLHSVAGAAGTLGLKDIGNLARSCEETIIALTRRGEGSSADLRANLSDFLQISKASLR